MRMVSHKRRKLLDEVQQWREDFVRRIGRCEKCLKPALNLDVHELVPGYVRGQALSQEYAVLALHRQCHNQIEGMTIPRQMAYLLRSRPGSFDLEAYHALIGRRWPDIDEIMVYYEELKCAIVTGK